MCNSATVHGVFIGEVSPVKHSRTKTDVRYFEGKLSDGKKTVRMVSFEPKLRATVEKAWEGGEAVAVTNCSVQESKKGGFDGMEIVASTRTAVVKSPKKFNIGDDVKSEASSLCGSVDLMAIEGVSGLAVNQRVNVTGKIQSVGEAEKVEARSRGGTLTKQDFVIADCTGAIRGVAWEKDVGVLEPSCSYKLMDITIRSFNGVRYLSLSSKSTIQEVGDIGEVVEGVIDDGEGVVKGEIVGVVGCDSYSSCKSCKAKVVEVSEVVGECSKCGMKVKMSRCTKSVAARLVVGGEAGKGHRVTAFNEVVDDIIRGVDGSDVSEELLSVPMMKFTIVRDVIVSVSKEV